MKRSKTMAVLVTGALGAAAPLGMFGMVTAKATPSVGAGASCESTNGSLGDYSRDYPDGYHQEHAPMRGGHTQHGGIGDQTYGGVVNVYQGGATNHDNGHYIIRRSGDDSTYVEAVGGSGYKGWDQPKHNGGEGGAVQVGVAGQASAHVNAFGPTAQTSTNNEPTADVCVSAAGQRADTGQIYKP
jgi:hypothetical protein